MNFTPVTKRKRKKHVSKLYRNVLIQQSGGYTTPYDTLRVIAFLPDVERYFQTIGKAKQYVDKHYKEISAEQNKGILF